MKHTKMIACLLSLLLVFSLAGCGSNGNEIYVQSVKELTGFGGIAPGDRFAGMVVSENVAQIQKDQEKSVKELLVSEGEDVTQGQALFSYDTDQLQLDLDKKNLELEQLKASIVNYQDQIAELEKDRDRASSSDKLQYTVEIQTAQLNLKEAELNQKAKEAEVAAAQAILENATVVSPVDGRIQSINENGFDNYGNPLPYISIQQSGAFRVKGSIGELQRGGITEGTRLKIFSRTDESQSWTGTVALVDYESPSQGSEMDAMYGVVADDATSSSKYPFYVTLDGTEGLILGQHVYMELEAAPEEVPGLSISAAFITYDEAGNPFVWAEKRGKLETRPVELGEYDPMNDTVAILSGLTEEDYIAFPDPELCQEGAPTTHSAPEADIPAEDMPEEVG